MFNVIYMWHVPCVVTTQNRIFCVWLYLMLLPPYLAQHSYSILSWLVLEDLLEDSPPFGYSHIQKIRLWWKIMYAYYINQIYNISAKSWVRKCLKLIFTSMHQVLQGIGSSDLQIWKWNLSYLYLLILLHFPHWTIHMRTCI